MFRRILVPLDGSLLAEAALAPAFELAQKFGGDVVLLRVVPPDELEFSGGLYVLSRVWEQQERQTAQTYLQQVRAGQSACDVPIRLEVQVGVVPSTIIATMARVSVSLIVMSTHGRSGLGRLIYGSVAEAVMRAAKVPVLFVPVRARGLRADGAAVSQV